MCSGSQSVDLYQPIPVHQNYHFPHYMQRNLSRVRLGSNSRSNLKLRKLKLEAHRQLVPPLLSFLVPNLLWLAAPLIEILRSNRSYVLSPSCQDLELRVLTNLKS